MFDCGSCLFESTDLNWMDEIFIMIVAGHSEVHHNLILAAILQCQSILFFLLNFVIFIRHQLFIMARDAIDYIRNGLHIVESSYCSLAVYEYLLQG